MNDSNQKIIRNTAFLYIRMFVTMCISFITTRIVLDKLGVSDYGTNNIVSGFVSMFTVLNSILQTGTRRFLALCLGKKDDNLLKETFSTAFFIHLGIGLLVILLLETIGVWFLNNKLNIPDNRIFAANWIFQFSTLNVFFNITQTPYIAAVTAHERFNMYAYLSIFEAIAKVLIVYLLVIIPGDKLIIYGALLLCVNFLNILFYRIYCIKNFIECSFSIKINKIVFKEMFQFSGWSTLGHFSAIFNSHGISIILNIFFGITINAARGLADTVTFTIKQFVNGFMIASQPQLVKFYGAGEKDKFFQLIFNVSKYTLFLLSIMIVPVVLEIDYVLNLWLNTVPEFTPIFIKISIIICLLSYSNIMLDQGIVAAGYMKQLTLITTPVYLLNLPITYIVLKFGGTPPMAYMVGSLPLFLAFLLNLYILKKFTGFPARKYFITIFCRNIFLVLLASILPYYIQTIMNSGLYRFLVVCSVSVVSTISILYVFGLDKETKMMVNSKLKSITKK